MNAAIKLAIEKGGYDTETATGYPTVEFLQLHKMKQYTLEDGIVLDPLFWQALGKALGWKEPLGISFLESTGVRWDWPRYAHAYFDLVLTGGDIEKFFNQLIKHE